MTQKSQKYTKIIYDCNWVLLASHVMFIISYTIFVVGVISMFSITVYKEIEFIKNNVTNTLNTVNMASWSLSIVLVFLVSPMVWRWYYKHIYITDNNNESDPLIHI